MSVARAFKSLTVGDFTGLTIEVKTLYALSGPHVDPALREAVIEEAKTGTRITKEEADRIAAELVAEQTRKLTEQFNSDVESVKADAIEKLGDRCGRHRV
jgi:hypothetical protein